MRKEFIKELNDLKIRMIKSEEFAKKLPLYSEKILREKLTESDDFINFGNWHKEIYLAWGINRLRYGADTCRSICNLPSETPRNIFLFSIYVNCCNLFDDEYYYAIAKTLSSLCVNVFHFDVLNSTFYVEDEYIEQFLDRLNNWYCNHIKNIQENEDKIKIEKLKKEIEKLENKQNKDNE